MAWVLLWLPLSAGGCDSDSPEPPCQGQAVACVEMTTRCELQTGCAIGPRCVEGDEGCASLATEAACASRTVCRWESACVGVRDPCVVVDNAQTCDLNVGCLWSASSVVCLGVPTPCEEISDARCDIQAGCYLDGVCRREPDCGTFSVTDCTARPDCAIGEGCAGDVAPCADFATRETCEWHVGCTWSP